MGERTEKPLCSYQQFLISRCPTGAMRRNCDRVAGSAATVGLEVRKTRQSLEAIGGWGKGRKTMSDETRLVFDAAFHRHLDQCKQCELHPFDLCREGAILLRACAIELQARFSSDSLREAR
jgi:hypothetical protein